MSNRGANRMRFWQPAANVNTILALCQNMVTLVGCISRQHFWTSLTYLSAQVEMITREDNALMLYEL